MNLISDVGLRLCVSAFTVLMRLPLFQYFLFPVEYSVVPYLGMCVSAVCTF
jgi:hypothetical protein